MTLDKIDRRLVAATDRIAELEQQLAAKDADAARWRWITRDGRARGLKIPATENKASIDAAIDKARNQ